VTTAIVVGAGPNGLAAAALLARNGVSVPVLEGAATIGGGTRSSEYLVPGLLHDHCSAVHPLAISSPLFRHLDLPGIRWRAPEVDCAHPLDDGTAGAFYRSFEQTEAALGVDGARWRRVFEPIAARFDELFEDVSQPVLRIPRHPVTMARFGARVVAPATLLARLWTTPQARALWSGVAAHAFWRLDRPMTSAIGFALTAAAHTHGWVVAEGGSQAIADALAADITAHGGTIETGVTVSSIAQLPPHDLLLLDVSPSVALRILGDRLPSRVAGAYRRFQHGPGACPPAGRAPCTSAEPSTRSSTSSWPCIAERCRLDRSSSSGSSTSPTRPDRSARSTRCGPTPTCRAATRATPLRRSSIRSNGSPRAFATASSARR
jgi:phytoene dehydrogenase-like protein